jgi:hypothetical protein
MARPKTGSLVVWTSDEARWRSGIHMIGERACNMSDSCPGANLWEVNKQNSLVLVVLPPFARHPKTSKGHPAGRLAGRCWPFEVLVYCFPLWLGELKVKVKVISLLSASTSLVIPAARYLENIPINCVYLRPSSWAGQRHANIEGKCQKCSNLYLYFLYEFRKRPPRHTGINGKCREHRFV